MTFRWRMTIHKTQSFIKVIEDVLLDETVANGMQPSHYITLYLEILFEKHLFSQK